ncbi:MAG TPA: Tad domain-containing protein [Bryobacteraceae bacterium]|nr:Tad domain-containing protein [Bryobacteraceae bacterium]
MNHPPARRQEAGQAVLLVVVAFSLFVIGALGLALDGGQMYSHRQMAQTSADAAAQAGILSVFAGTNATSAYPFATGTPPAAFTCTMTDGRAPCVYARQNGFGGAAADTVAVDFPTAVPGVNLAPVAVPAVRVSVQRTIQTGLIRFLGPSAAMVGAVGIAAIVNEMGPIPLLVMHPTLASVLMTGAALVRVCGGPSRSVQVDSNSSIAVALGKGMDLSHAGPNDPGDCTTGTGADFAVVGGPSTLPGGLLLGTTGNYVQPALTMPDPYRNIPDPAVPTTLGTKSPISGHGCPIVQCTLYSPGLYTGGIKVKNETALFMPGLYYINGGGFGNAANGIMLMATGFPPDSATGSGMVVYNTGAGVFNIGANASATLTGSDNSSSYQGILFFQDRHAPAQTHSLGGGGQITLNGTLYITDTRDVMLADPSQYQTVTLGGNSGIQINGSIVVSLLQMWGTSNITFNLSAGPILMVQRLGLVQ